MASLEQPTRCQVARSRNTLSGGTQRAVHHAVDGGKVEQGCGSSGEGKCATLGGWCHGREGTHALASAASGQPRLRFGIMTRPASRLRALPEILCPPAMVTRVWKICNQVAERQREQPSQRSNEGAECRIQLPSAFVRWCTACPTGCKDTSIKERCPIAKQVQLSRAVFAACLVVAIHMGHRVGALGRVHDRLQGTRVGGGRSQHLPLNCASAPARCRLCKQVAQTGCDMRCANRRHQRAAPTGCTNRLHQNHSPPGCTRCLRRQ